VTDKEPEKFEELLGSHHQDFNEIRRLSLICYGLDSLADQLFTGSSYRPTTLKTKCVFQNLMSGSLLNLAISLRVNFYQGTLDSSSQLSMECASLYYDSNLVIKTVSIKDVVDKVIHANSVSKQTFPRGWVGYPKIMMHLRGFHRKENWTLDICIRSFAIAVLELLDKQDLHISETKGT